MDAYFAVALQSQTLRCISARSMAGSDQQWQEVLGVALTVEIRHQRQDRPLRLGQDVLRYLDARGTQRRHTGCRATLHRPALRQHLARR